MPRGEPHARSARDERETCVRLTARGPRREETGTRCAPAWLCPAAPCGHRLNRHAPAAVVRRPVVHDVVGVGKAALVPGQAEPADRDAAAAAAAIALSARRWARIDSDPRKAPVALERGTLCGCGSREASRTPRRARSGRSRRPGASSIPAVTDLPASRCASPSWAPARRASTPPPRCSARTRPPRWTCSSACRRPGGSCGSASRRTTRSSRRSRARSSGRRSGPGSASSATSRWAATSRTTELAELYDAVVYAVGAQTGRRLGIPGEDLAGSWSATELVAWYNGHPDFQEIAFDLQAERAVVVGAGNVALDVARMLALTAEELAPTDTTDRAIEAIVRPGLREIVVLARRGPAQAAFTTPELKEMGELAGADILVDPAELELDPASEASLDDEHERAPQRRGAARLRGPRRRAGQPRAVRIRFCVSPVAILGESHVEAVEIVRNELVADESRPGARRPDRASARRSRAAWSSAASAISACRSPGCRSTSAAARAERRRSRARRRRGAAPGRLRRRLDQARPDRRDRHEQEGRHRDGRAPARGRARRPAARARAAGPDARSSCSPSAASSSWPTPAGSRSTPSSGPRASRTAARGSSSAPGRSCWPPGGPRAHGACSRGAVRPARFLSTLSAAPRVGSGEAGARPDDAGHGASARGWGVRARAAAAWGRAPSRGSRTAGTRPRRSCCGACGAGGAACRSEGNRRGSWSRRRYRRRGAMVEHDVPHASETSARKPPGRVES